MKKIKYSELGKGLRALRGDRTLKQVAALVNLTVPHICEMENGNKLPSINVMERYSRKLDTPIVLILGGQDS